MRVRGRWWRIARPGTDPLTWTEEAADGRWQRGSVVRAIYLADSAQTAWAEWYRHSAELGLPPQVRLPRDLWQFAIDLEDVADLTAGDILARHGVPALSPSRSQWPQTQTIGELYWRAGLRGVLAPSAARVDGRVLAVFREHPGRVAGLTPMRPARRHTELPPLPTGLRT